MTRISLRETYDNRDVIAQICDIRDIAESAEDRADNAVSTANTATEHVDALVPQVEGAVQNANQASASAEASAQAVAGYENRLSVVEGQTATLGSDLGAVTLRVTTAEGKIVTIQGQVTSISGRLGTAEGKVRALETADTQNVKLTGERAIGNYAVLLTGNQDNITGRKSFLTPPVSKTGMGASFIHQVTDFDHSSRPANNTTLRMIEVDDNAGRYVGRLNLAVDANGNLRLRFEGYVIDAGGNRIVKSADIATLTV